MGSKPDEGGKSLAPGLYLTATPIGNLGDITIRALAVLRDADLIACEDTRVSAKLLRHYNITTPTTPYHDHNAARARPALLDRLARGQAIALISDAGTPLISDPGHKLVRDALDHGFSVTTVPGPSAPLAALNLSGLPGDRFLFAGFLPSKSGARRQVLEDLADTPATLLFFESARRLGASLADMADRLGDRDAAVARELTKLHEEVRRGSLAELAAHYAASGAPKGEVVVAVAPPVVQPVDQAQVDAMLRHGLQAGSVRETAAAVASATGLKRRDLYTRALALKDNNGEPDP